MYAYMYCILHTVCDRPECLRTPSWSSSTSPTVPLCSPWQHRHTRLYGRLYTSFCTHCTRRSYIQAFMPSGFNYCTCRHVSAKKNTSVHATLNEDRNRAGNSLPSCPVYTTERLKKLSSDSEGFR